jgi:arylsulfatase A-like enzyme
MAKQLPNVLLITVDCLRYDHLGCYGYKRGSTPHIDKIASKGVLFRQAISNGGNTSSSFPSILASALPPLYDSEHKTIIRRHTTLAEIFKKAGYRTAAFHSNPLLTRLRNYDKGFDIFDEGWGNTPWFWKSRIWIAETALKIVSRMSSRRLMNFLSNMANYIDSLLFVSRVRNPVASGEQISARAVSWLKSHNKNFFLWLHYMDAHIPYMPPREYVKQFSKKPMSRRKIVELWRKSRWSPEKLSPAELETIIELYDACVRHADDSIGWLLSAIGSRLKNTIIIVSADHGDEFREHGKMSHLTLYDGIVHVPLVIAGPGIEPDSSVSKQVELMDLAPTLVDLVGLDKPATFNGQTLLPLMRGKNVADKGVVSVASSIGTLGQPDIWLHLMFSYRTPGWKYIRVETAAPPHSLVSEEIYNLEDDPKENRNLNAHETPEVLRFKLEAVKAVERLKKEKARDLTELEVRRVKRIIKKLKI